MPGDMVSAERRYLVSAPRGVRPPMASPAELAAAIRSADYLVVALAEALVPARR
jgi:hypothetical protein